MIRFCKFFTLFSFLLGYFCHAETPLSPIIPEQEQEQETQKNPSKASVHTRTNARTMTLTIPSPRGLIMDRKGEVLANNKVVYNLSLQFPEFEKTTDSQILTWARTRIDSVKTLSEKEWNISDRKILNHYQHRRWLPLSFTAIFNESQVKKLTPSLIEGLIFHPLYIRNYPKNRSSCHILGYVRSTGKLPDGPINHGDPLWEHTYGAEGLEKIFNRDLSGRDGTRKIIIDSDGTSLLDELEHSPEVGNSLVLTINSKWQSKAEKTLSRYSKKGALVLLDIVTGEVLTLASYPYYDLNVWIPRISESDYSTLRDDKDSPMFARAFQARYPPASTFKAVVAAAVLSNGTVTPKTMIDCPAFVKVGNKKFHNHTRKPDGYLNVKKALARSNNCWFYQVGLDAGPETFLSAAREFGFGSKTGLPLFNETSGLVPTNEYYMKAHGRPILDGDTANLSIGQGAMAASPLQVAQGMAAIANGKVLPKLRLIKQIQKANGSVIEAPSYEARTELSLSSSSLETVAKGMYDVIHAPYGTGKKGNVGFTKMVGKTGTAQWVQGKELAWFAGFFPYDNPRFAYAVLYEGSKGEQVSGGRKAAPIIKSFLSSISSDIQKYLEPKSQDGGTTPDSSPLRAIVLDENGSDPGPQRAIIIDDAPSATTPLRAIIVEEEEISPAQAALLNEQTIEKVPVSAIVIEEEEVE